jgi:hypothetical protein
MWDRNEAPDYMRSGGGHCAFLGVMRGNATEPSYDSTFYTLGPAGDADRSGAKYRG